MAETDMAETANQAGAAIGELMDAVWVLSALASVLSMGIDVPLSPDDPAARVLASRGLLEPTEVGLQPTPGFAEAVGGRAQAVTDIIRSTLGQASSAAFGTAAGWSGFTDEILIAQGRASTVFAQILARGVIPVFDGLAERFAGGGALLDVGTGVAELACAFCREVPGASVVGIDSLPRAIELGAITVARRHLAGQIELRRQGVEELEDEEAFDLAWLPLQFVPYAAVCEGLPRVLRALRKGGWLLLSGPMVKPGPSGDIVRWQVHLSGGTALGEGDSGELLTGAGFESPTPVSLPPGAPPIFVLAARRPAAAH
jgi:SAM-dependent methyltransferase